MSHWPANKSEAKVVTPGTTTEFFDFAQLTAPDGGRVVIDKFTIVIQGTITAATALWDGRDVWRLMQLVTVEKRDGRQRWNLSGCKSRFASIKYNGIDEHQEHGNVSIGASQPVELRAIIPMRKPFLRRPNDYALPADAFKKLSINWAALANAQTGACVLTAQAMTAYVEVEWHSESKVEFKVDDIVKSVDFTSATQVRTALSGVVHDLDIVKEGVSAGGDSVAAITDARIDDLGMAPLTFNDLKHSYTMKRRLAPSGPTTPATERFLDPVRESKMLPVITADNATSPWDGKVIDSLKLDVGTGAAGLAIITREVYDKSEADYRATVSRFKIDESSIQFASGDAASNGVDTRPVKSVSKRKQLTGTWVASLNKAI